MPYHNIDKKRPDSRTLAICFMYSLVMVSISSCAPPMLENEPMIESPFADRSFISGNLCPPPCWYGLEPGKSDKMDVYTILQELEFVDEASISEGITNMRDYENASSIMYDCIYEVRGSFCGELIVSSDGVLRAIVHSIAYPLSFQESVDLLGPPNILLSFPYSPHGGGCVIKLLWEEKGISVAHIDKETSLLCDAIREGSSVDPNTLVLSLKYVSLDIAIQWKEILTYIPWPGFEN